MKKDISIITVNYNSHKYIENCLNSIISNTRDINYEILIVDNYSPDRDIINLKSKFSNIEFYLLDDNRGFGSACNYGSQNSSGKYLVFVNPDTVFTNNSLKNMFDFMEQTTDAAVCSPAFIYQDGSQGYVYNNFPNIMWEFYDFLGKGYNLRINKLNRKLQESAKSGRAMRIDWATGACLIVKKDFFNKVGGFNEDYFLYYEDVDLQKRITDAGGSIYCLPYLKVIHVANTSTKPDDDDTVYYYNINKSRLMYHMKNSSTFKKLFVKYLHLAGFYLRLFSLKFRSRYSEKKNMKKLQYMNIIKYYRTGLE
ncbi:MAG: glycosyltransferase family 2 protein [Candidatus Kapaibacterium sp.]